MRRVSSIAAHLVLGGRQEGLFGLFHIQAVALEPSAVRSKAAAKPSHHTLSNSIKSGITTLLPDTWNAAAQNHFSVNLVKYS